VLLACDEHLDRALDEFTERHREPPDLFLLNQVAIDNREGERACSFCSREAVYVLRKYADKDCGSRKT
jgi:CxxH/CxxC protein (TIGR04129 family)